MSKPADAESLTLTTADGYRIAALRYPAAGATRGHQPGRVDALFGDALAAQDQGLIGAVHGRVVQPARAGQAFAQTDDAAEGIDDAKAVARRPGDQQPAIVGPQIERAVEGHVAT